jgi:hypothetical protein
MFESGLRDVRAAELERVLPWIDPDDGRVRERLAERDREARHARADVENPYAGSAQAGVREERGDRRRRRALRLQDRRVAVAPRVRAARVVHQLDGLMHVRPRERDDDVALAFRQPRDRIARIEHVDDMF